MPFPQPSLSFRIPVQFAGVALLGLEGDGRQRVERFVATVKAD